MKTGVDFVLFKHSCMNFSTASAVLSSVVVGGLDTVYLHTLDREECGEHFSALVHHPALGKQDHLVTNVFNSSISSELAGNAGNALTAASLFVLAEVGGLVLPPHRLVTADLTTILRYETVVERESRLLGGHPKARLWQVAISLHQDGEGGARQDPVAVAAARYPALLTKLALPELLVPSGQLDSLQQLPGLVATTAPLLRRIWQHDLSTLWTANTKT